MQIFSKSCIILLGQTKSETVSRTERSSQKPINHPHAGTTGFDNVNYFALFTICPYSNQFTNLKYSWHCLQLYVIKPFLCKQTLKQWQTIWNMETKEISNVVPSSCLAYSYANSIVTALELGP
ncbi:hypothetical protein KUTeg_008034 [Tegillarca granosa]|uniref:Uncharacterized protein n=1 Tax=Tegillarca granosa TaxID=220873 RepID=A0ABQ9FDX7_TEGGR|nr:hypothetical protein KUTeg_008034 [Tegillarca granosa]